MAGPNRRRQELVAMLYVLGVILASASLCGGLLGLFAGAAAFVYHLLAG